MPIQIALYLCFWLAFCAFRVYIMQESKAASKKWISLDETIIF